MNNLAFIPQNFFRTLTFALLFFPALCGWSMETREKLEELRERSEIILGSLEALGDKLQRLSVSANAAPSGATPTPEDGTVAEPPLPEDSFSSETPLPASSPESEQIDWDSQFKEDSYDQPEFPANDELNDEESDFDFVIEKFEQEEADELTGDAPFESPATSYGANSGDYYLIFNYGIQFGSGIDFSSDSPDLSGELDVDWGHNLSLELGIPLDMMENLELGIVLGFNNAEISGFSGSSKTTTALTGADGEISNYYFAIRPNYTFELSDEMAIRAGTSLGLSSRHNHFDSEHAKILLTSSPNYIFQEEKLCILWDFHTTLQWALWENGGILFGYRFAYVTGTGNFEGHFGNSLEFGGRWGF